MPISKKKTSHSSFPKTEVQFNKWFTSFNRTFKSNSSKFSFTSNQIRNMKSAFNAWNKWYSTWQKAVNAQQRAFNNTITSRKNAESIINGFWNKIANSTANTGQFSSFGIPGKVKSTRKSTSVRSRKTTVARKTRSTSKRSSKSKSTINLHQVPFVKVDSTARGKNQVWVMPNSYNSGSFPTACKGVVLQFRSVGGRWQNLPTTNHFPFIHVVGSSKRGPIQYRAAYSYGKKKIGSWSTTSRAMFKAA